MVIHLQVADNIASLHFWGLGTAADNDPGSRGVLELPVDPGLGPADPNLRLLRAIQLAARAEIDRQRSGDRPGFVHVPEPLDLSDLGRFPSSGAR